MKFQKAQTDLLWTVALVLGFWLFAINVELSEHLILFSQGHEPMQLDELPWTLLVLSLALAWYSWRRNREAHEELQERIRAEQQVQELLTHNSDLAQRLFTAQEDERRALARDLHDEMGQTCTAIRTEAAVLVGGRLKPDEVLDSAQRIADAAQQVSLLTRNMLQRLRPAVLDSMGIADALLSLCEQWQESAGVPCHFQAEGLPDNLDDYVCVTLYRLLQESLTNVARHARASKVQVQLTWQHQQTLRLHIQDDGVGMADPEANHAGFGLLGMRERVSSLGGQLFLQSAPGRGFQVQAVLPLEAA
jgi:two-component system sensor histidine kinase UhpB